MTPRQALVTTVLLGLLAFEIFTLGILVAFPYLPDPGSVWLNSMVYVLLEPLTTVLTLGLLYSWLAKGFANEASRRSVKVHSFLRFVAEPFRSLLASMSTTSLSDAALSIKLLSHPRVMLTISLVVSIALGFIPYRPDINPTGSLVGVDSPLYVSWLNQMLALSWPQAINYAFVGGLEGSRPLLLIFLYLPSSIGISPTLIVEATPMILSPLLTLSVYTFVRYGQGSARLAGLTGLLTSVSFYITVGLWGGYYANMLAVVFAFLFMTMLLVFSRQPSVSNYVLMLFLSIALFLTHPWTWVLVLTVGLVFAIMVWNETRLRVHLESIVGLIGTGVFLDILKSIFFATRSTFADIATKSPSSAGSVLNFWNNLVLALLYTHDGLMADWLILGLAALAAFILRFHDRFERLVLLWTAIPSIPFLLLDSYNQARIIYDLPVPILTGIAIVMFVPQMTRNTRLSGIILALILVTITNYALRAVLSI